MSNFESMNAPQTLRINWTREVIDDCNADRPDDSDCGFWPSEDSSDAGYIGENPETPYDEQMAAAQDRMFAYETGQWGFVGVRAKAEIWIPIGSGSFRIMELESAGLWGIESDAGDYLDEVYSEERDALLDELKTLGVALTAGEYVESGI